MYEKVKAEYGDCYLRYVTNYLDHILRLNS